MFTFTINSQTFPIFKMTETHYTSYNKKGQLVTFASKNRK